MWGISRLWCLLVFAGLSIGCEASLTEVLVVVDTDLSVPGEVDLIQVEVTGPDGELTVADGMLTSASELPRTLALVHRGGSLGPVTATARGLLSGVVVAERVATFAFVEGELRVLRLNLLRSCVGTTCASGETCARAGCRSIEVSADELESYSEPLGRLDGGTREDGGPPIDAGPTDAGPTDAGLDASLDGGSDAGPDPACTGLPADCGTGASSCTCSSCTCDVVCTADCDVSCQDTDQCNTDATRAGTVNVDCVDSTCVIEGLRASNVAVRASGSDVEVNCRMAASCSLDCEAGSTCLLDCFNASSCEMRTCDGMVTPCGMEIVACNRACP